MSLATRYLTRRTPKRPRIADNEALARCFGTLRSNETAPPEQRAKTIRSLLQQLGPLYSSFALYLSSRIDLLPAEYCREFALTPDSSSPLPSGTVEQLLTSQLDVNFGLLFPEFDPVPQRSTLISQTHFARLRSGNPVAIVLLRPEYYSLRTEDGIPESFDSVFLRSCCSEIVAEDTVQDFFNALRRKTNFAAQAESMDRMAQDATSLEFLGSGKVHTELCTDGIMVVEHLEGRSLDQFLRAVPYSADLAAMRLCQVWLHMAFFGKCYPVDPQERNVLIPSSRQICFRECDLATLPKTAKENLWNYLTAAATDDPDKAALHLLSEMSTLPHTRVDPEAFRSSFRQAASFGVLEPVLGTNSNSLSQLVFQHWTTALEHGYIPQPHLLSLYRGLFSIARIGRKISPTRDPLREGLEELRATRTLRRFAELVEWDNILRESDKFATAFAQFPKVLDNALSNVTPLSQESLLLNRPQQTQPGSSNSFGSLAIVLLLAATVFISQSSLGISRWAPHLAALTLMLAGLLVLKRIAG